MKLRTIRLLRSGFRRLSGRTDAVAATEYAILLALLILGAMGTIRLIGEKFHNLYAMIANAVGDTM